jgi:steroid delta-isomerase-like uncharacterized protein
MGNDIAALMRRLFEEVWNQQKLDVIDETHARDFVFRGPPTQKEYRGPEGYRELAKTYITIFPDLHFAVDDQIISGDRVAVRWTATGTHKGEMMGIARTGREVKNVGIAILRISGGKIAEEWVRWDTLDMLQQMGAIPKQA